jgi:hypothetical protein
MSLIETKKFLASEVKTAATEWQVWQITADSTILDEVNKSLRGNGIKNQSIKNGVLTVILNSPSQHDMIPELKKLYKKAKFKQLSSDEVLKAMR